MPRIKAVTKAQYFKLVMQHNNNISKIINYNLTLHF